MIEVPKSVTINMREVEKQRREFWIKRYRYMLKCMIDADLCFWPKDPHGEDYGRDPDIEMPPELMTRKQVEEALSALERLAGQT